MSRTPPKVKTVFGCAECGHQSPKWLGQCPSCRLWNTLHEEVALPEPKAGSTPRGWGVAGSAKPMPLSEVEARSEDRILTGIGELDRVLGGGVVPGSLVLLGGDPGIGKSTLLLAALDRLALAAPDRPILYVSGEESARQTKLRADRLGVTAKNLQVLAETDATRVLHHAEALKPAAVAIDSIQTQYLPELQSAPGTVSQIREVTARLMAFAKTTETPTFLVGHVTKDGSIAGPRVLEHMVDTVLYFEGGGAHPYRVLRAHKNRFGSASEIGVFEMKSGGLAEVPNPSALFLAERPVDAPGSAVTAVLNGTRTVLVEVQALVAPTGFGTPRRTALGFDQARVALLAAVLEKKVGLEILDATSSSTSRAGSRSTTRRPTWRRWRRSRRASATAPSPSERCCSAKSGSRARCGASPSLRSGSPRRPGSASSGRTSPRPTRATSRSPGGSRSSGWRRSPTHSTSWPDQAGGRARAAAPRSC